MLLDAALVLTAEINGLRTLATLPRPKASVVAEDVLGALCLWTLGGTSEACGRDDLRLVPGAGVPLADVLRSVRDSRVRPAGRHLLIRGAASSFDAAAEDLLLGLGATRNAHPWGMCMARELDSLTSDPDLVQPGMTVTVARDAKRHAQLRALVRKVYGGHGEDDEAPPENEGDIFNAPGTKTYLAVEEDGQVISTASILIVDRVANIWSVATHVPARGRGAASAVTHAACAEAHRQGATVAALRTDKDLAKPGGLYNRVGFAVVGEEDAWNLDARGLANH